MDYRREVGGVGVREVVIVLPCKGRVRKQHPYLSKEDIEEHDANNRDDVKHNRRHMKC